MRSYARPQSLTDAVSLLANGPHRILAGGTDLYPSSGPQIDGNVLDLAAIADLEGISQTQDLRIGARTTWTTIADAALPPALFALQQAARQVGGRQIQNVGTIGGNLCNASPAADGVPPLLMLDAAVELASPNGLRALPLAEFLLGPRKTARRADEVLTAVIIPAKSLEGTSAFLKLGARAYLVISIAMVAAKVTITNGQISAAAIAVGACSGVAQRLPCAEHALIGATPSQAIGRLTDAIVGSALSPIDDLRATGDYRLTAAAELVRRAVQGALA